MKNLRKLFLFALAIGVFVITSCKKEDNVNNTADSLASEVVGTYSGTLRNSITNQSKTAIITVTKQNDSLVMMHCVGGSFDSTFTICLYQNYDSIMGCYTGQDFYNEYGHYTNNYDFCNNQQTNWTNSNWMNDDNCYGNEDNNWGNSTWAGNNQWNAWTNHMNTQHNQFDRHYCGFDPITNTCYFEFSMHNNSTNYFEIFEGTK